MTPKFLLALAATGLAAATPAVAANSGASRAKPATAQTAAAEPQAAPKAPSASVAGKVYEVKGLRGATWGMTRDEVLADIKKDFGAGLTEVKTLDNPADGTSALAATVSKLAPGPGPATITYIFGKTSKQLMHVNVVWLVPGDVTVMQRDELLRSGLKLVDYFKGYSWANHLAVGGVPVGPTSVVMFFAKDAAGGMLEVRADGVPFKRADGAMSQPKSGPARLRISYGQTATSADTAKIAPGLF
jgi:hypothetical protein